MIISLIVTMMNWKNKKLKCLSSFSKLGKNKILLYKEKIHKLRYNLH